jgi:pilus assembly protein Flp/PilA
MLTILSRLHRDSRGASAIEYGLIAALISVVITASTTTAGTSLRSLFQTISTSLSGAVGS